MENPEKTREDLLREKEELRRELERLAEEVFHRKMSDSILQEAHRLFARKIAEQIIFGFVGLVLVAVVGAILSLVIK